MTLHITDTLITSDVTHHTATKGESGWTVTWWNPAKLGERTFDRNAAITAMSLAEEVAKGRDDPNTTNFSWKRWQLIAGWTQELGLKGLQAVAILEEWPTGKASGKEDV
jgi:hypothetical protein